MKTYSIDRLWTASFYRMCVVNFLVTSSIFALVALFPNWVAESCQCHAGVFPFAFALSAFALGLYLPGVFNSYLVDRFKRRRVCIFSIAVIMAVTFSFHWVQGLVSVALLRVVQGAAFAVMQMSLGSTLVNDLSISENRTRADYYYAWAGRFGVPAGLLVGLFVLEYFGLYWVWILSMSACAFSIVLTESIAVPFRAPIGASRCSLDRFFQGHSLLLFLNFLPISVMLGLFVAELFPIEAYALIIGGFLLAIVVHKLVFVDADMRAEMVGGLLLMIAAVILLITQHVKNIEYVVFPMGSLGLGLVSSRFLLYFLKLSAHCQRGTLQNTFMLCWETGICIGFCMSFVFDYVYFICLALLVITLVIYLTLTHPWFEKHKDRDFKFKEV